MSAVALLAAVLLQGGPACDCSLPPALCPPPVCPSGIVTTTVVEDCIGCRGCSSPTCAAGPACLFAIWSSGPPGLPLVPPLYLPKFAPAHPCEQLIGMELDVRAAGCAHYCLENLGPVTCPAATAQTVIVIQLTAPLASIGTVTLPMNWTTQFPPLAPFDGIEDCAGTSGIQLNPVVEIRQMCLRINDASDLAAFLDTQPGNGVPEYTIFQHTALSSANVNGCFPLLDRIEAHASIQVRATYTSCLCLVGAANDAVTTPAGTPVDIDVLANDTTTCGAISCGTLKVSVPPPATCGTASALPACAGPSCAGCRVRFTPAPGFTGTCTFFYSVASTSHPLCVDRARVTVTVQ